MQQYAKLLLLTSYELWTAYTGASLILDKPFRRFSFYDIVCFLILASGPYLDATITSENIFRSSSIDVTIFNFGPLILNASLSLDDFFGRFRIFYNQRFSEGPS